MSLPEDTWLHVLFKSSVLNLVYFFLAGNANSLEADEGVLVPQPGRPPHHAAGQKDSLQSTRNPQQGTQVDHINGDWLGT